MDSLSKNRITPENMEKVDHGGISLSSEQQRAITSIKRETTYLLQGVTGSGKTEVYFRLIETILKSRKQVLFLVPEIGLTPQTILRFRARFGVKV